MKIKKMIMASLLSTISISVTALAGTEVCPKDAVHCAYIEGLSNSVEDARWIKLHNERIGDIVVCFNNNSFISLTEEGASAYLGNNTDVYSICRDKTGHDCEQIGIDNFTVFSSFRTYNGEPHFYAINLAKVKDHFPVCGGF